jgi:hypothetical protein
MHQKLQPGRHSIQFDRLKNKTIEILEDRGLGWDTPGHFGVGGDLIKTLVDIDGHHACLETRTKKIPF